MTYIMLSLKIVLLMGTLMTPRYPAILSPLVKFRLSYSAIYNVDICSKWLHDNKLTVNASKSQVMLVGPKCKVQDEHLTVYLNNTELQQSSSIKLLGINIDSDLNWKPHVEFVISKVSVKVGLLHRLSRFLSSFHLKGIANRWV